MARRCSICGRGPQTTLSRSHSNAANKRRQYLNLQTKTISGKKIKICTSCLRSLKKKMNLS